MRRAIAPLLLLLLQISDASTLPATAKLKVLALHGYSQNAQILRDRSGGFRKPMKKSKYEVTCLDGPFGCTANGEDIAVADADKTRRAWWRGNSLQDTYVGWDETRALIVDLWEREQFDGIMGFSQGAGAAAMLCAELQPRFAILISGFVARDIEAGAGLLAGVDNAPSLHVFGESDQLVVPDRSRALVECFTDATVIAHEGGHMIPSGATVRRQVVAFLDSV